MERKQEKEKEQEKEENKEKGKGKQISPGAGPSLWVWGGYYFTTTCSYVLRT